MATKSFLKDVVIKNKEEAVLFLNALEEAEKAKKKDIRFEKKVKTISDAKKIKEMFS